ncbi:MAG: hypothetical protein ACYTDT_07190 [Planctomycetota bacterium]|jgi:hypothetical protein
MENFAKYHALRAEGIKPTILYMRAIQDGLGFSACIRMLRYVCNLTLAEARDVIILSSRLPPISVQLG